MLCLRLSFLNEKDFKKLRIIIYALLLIEPLVLCLNDRPLENIAGLASDIVSCYQKVFESWIVCDGFQKEMGEVAVNQKRD